MPPSHDGGTNGATGPAGPTAAAPTRARAGRKVRLLRQSSRSFASAQDSQSDGVRLLCGLRFFGIGSSVFCGGDLQIGELTTCGVHRQGKGTQPPPVRRAPDGAGERTGGKKTPRPDLHSRVGTVQRPFSAREPRSGHAPRSPRASRCAGARRARSRGGLRRLCSPAHRTPSTSAATRARIRSGAVGHPVLGVDRGLAQRAVQRAACNVLNRPEIGVTSPFTRTERSRSADPCWTC
jgi:hypothetical protein